MFKYLEGPTELAFDANKKLVSYSTPIACYWRKSDVYNSLKNQIKIKLEFSDKYFIFKVFFFKML